MLPEKETGIILYDNRLKRTRSNSIQRPIPGFMKHLFALFLFCLPATLLYPQGNNDSIARIVAKIKSTAGDAEQQSAALSEMLGYLLNSPQTPEDRLLEYFTLFKKRASETGNPIYLASYHFRKADYYRIRESYSFAMQHLDSSMQFFKKAGNKKGIYNVVNQVLRIDLMFNRFESIKRDFYYYYPLAEKDTAFTVLPNLLRTIANVYLKTGEANYDSAVYYANKGIEVAGKYLPAAIPSLESIKSTALFYQGKYRQSINSVLSSIKVSAENNVFYIHSNNLKLLAMNYALTGQQQLADFYRDSLLRYSQNNPSDTDTEEMFYTIELSRKNYQSAAGHMLAFIKAIEKEYRNSITEKDKFERDNVLLQFEKLKSRENEIARLDAEARSRKRLMWVLIIAVATTLWLFFQWRITSLRKKALFEKIGSENELKVLRAQVNPHFVQNIFDFIARTVRTQNNETAVQKIKAVSEYFRETLIKANVAAHSIEEELNFIKKYLETLQLLQPGLFEFIIEIDEHADTDLLQVPALLLQPIVENSIKHGFSEIQQGGLVHISVKQNNNLLIIITDNGKGCETNMPGNESSVGLQLVKRRLQLFYKNNRKIKPEVFENTHSENTGYATLIKFSLYE